MSTNNDEPLDTQRYAFLQEALDGSGGFKDGAYLTKFSRESDEKYKKRRELSWFVNYLRPNCERFVGYLSKKSVDRTVEHPLLEAFVDNCDWRGNSIDVFLQNFYVSCKAKGTGLLLVDMPKVQPANLQQQFSTRFFPYLVSIKPETVRGFTVNQQGLLDNITIEVPMVVEGKNVAVLRHWDTSKWSVTKDNIVLEEGEHNLGRCPVLVFSEGESFPHVGAFAQIADIGKRLFNLNSELDELIRNQTFSILTYQIPIEQQGGLDVALLSESIGTNNMLIYAGTQAPSFAQPSADPANVIIKTIEKLEEKIGVVGHDVNINFSQTSSSESGVALNIRFQSLNAALFAFARKGEDLERRVFELCCKWLGINNTTAVNYAKTYELADITTELASLAQYTANDFPEDVVKAKKKQIIGLDFSNMEKADLTALLDSVDSFDQTKEVLESRVALLEAKQPDTVVEDEGSIN